MMTNNDIKIVPPDFVFPLSVYSLLMYDLPYLATYSLLPLFGIIKKIYNKAMMSIVIPDKIKAR